MSRRRAFIRAGLAVALLASLPFAMTPSAGLAHAAGSLPPIKHVWVVTLENEANQSSESSVWGNGNTSSYLPYLTTQGAFVPNYWGIGHLSADNYLAMVSGEGPTQDTQSDCQVYDDGGNQNASNNTAPGQGEPYQGCVFQPKVKTIGDALAAVGDTWKGYMEDMGLTPSRDSAVTCQQPNNQNDPTQTATAQDQYALRHDPFMYFHSIIDTQSSCLAHVVQLQDKKVGLVPDLASVATTPNFSFVVPNLCNDGHDPSSPASSGCAGPDAKGVNNSGLAAIDDWLSVYVPAIMQSPAFKKDGMLVITFDEAAGSGNGDDSACCNSWNTGATGQNANGSNGINGPGGGKVGALVISPFVKPGTVSSNKYNHYSLLRGIQDLFGATTLPSSDLNVNGGYLGWAGTPQNVNNYAGPCDQTTAQPPQCTGPSEFGSDVFTCPSGTCTPSSQPSSGNPSNATGTGPSGTSGNPSGDTGSGSGDGNGSPSTSSGGGGVNGPVSITAPVAFVGAGATGDTPPPPAPSASPSAGATTATDASRAPGAAATASITGPPLAPVGGSLVWVWVLMLCALGALAFVITRLRSKSS